MVRYVNSNTSQVVDRQTPSARLERLPNWQRIDPDKPSPPAPVQANDPALATLRKADLQALCAEAGLPTDGTKAELLDRLNGRSQ